MKTKLLAMQEELQNQIAQKLQKQLDAKPHLSNSRYVKRAIKEVNSGNQDVITAINWTLSHNQSLDSVFFEHQMDIALNDEPTTSDAKPMLEPTTMRGKRGRNTGYAAQAKVDKLETKYDKLESMFQSGMKSMGEDVKSMGENVKSLIEAFNNQKATDAHNTSKPSVPTPR